HTHTHTHTHTHNHTEINTHTYPTAFITVKLYFKEQLLSAINTSKCGSVFMCLPWRVCVCVCVFVCVFVCVCVRAHVRALVCLCRCDSVEGMTSSAALSATHPFSDVVTFL